MLKIDLLPAHYAVARRNKAVIVLAVPLLVGVAAVWLLLLVNLKATITRTEEELAQATKEADYVRGVQTETETKKGELAPIQAKVDFVAAADKSGEAYWDRFHKINEYIYDRALVTNFSITPPAAVSFSVQLSTTEEAGRFILNMIRCPYVTGISISGTPGQSGAIQGAGGAAPAPAGGPGPGGPGMPGGPGAPGMPGGPGPGGPGMPGGEPGMAGPPGGGAPAAAGGTPGPITFSVTCTLVEPITVPTPPVPAAASAGGAGGPGGMPGGPGGPPGAGPPGGPGGPGGAPPGGPGGAPPGGPGGGKGGDKEDDGGGKKGGKDSGDEA